MAGGGRADLLMCGQDETIAEKLAWVDHFTAQAGPTLDVVSWHTYDFHASDIGLPDHTPLDPTNKTVARLWSTDYLDLALRLAKNVSALAKKNAPKVSGCLLRCRSCLPRTCFDPCASCSAAAAAAAAAAAVATPLLHCVCHPPSLALKLHPSREHKCK